MMKSKLLASTLGLALIAGPALAQQADAPMRRDLPMQNGAMPMPAPATTGPTAAPAVGKPMHEGHSRGMRAHDTQARGMGEEGMHRHHGKMRAERAAARAENRTDVGELVEQAGAALRAGRTAQATDLLEQGETRLLTRSAPADRADQPMRGPVLDRISAARGAIQARDRAGAMREIEQARTMLRAEPNSGAGTMSNAPAQGSGPGMGASGMGSSGMGSSGMGGHTMRDSGPAGTSMSRADNIIRVQAGGGGGSGGLSGSTPGSPGAGNPGSTPSTGMGTTTQPSQGSASPGVPTGSRTGSPGVGAPPPGATAPQSGGGSGAVGSGGTIRPGSTPSGGGTGSNPSR